MRSRPDLPFHEWQQEQDRLEKVPARGGVQSPIVPNLPGGPRRALPGPGIASPSPRSQYTSARPTVPDPWIDDVDEGGNFFSPFQPVWPFGAPNVNIPREWDYPVGYNLNFIQPRMELMSMLRGMARTWGVLATIISSRMDQLMTVPWTIQDRNNPRKVSGSVKEMREFFRRPDRKLSYSQWSRKLLYDLLELDAPTIYFARNRLGKPLAAEVLNGQTIFPLIDDAGRRPDSIIEIDDDGLSYLRRQPAFQQIIKGLPMVDLDESELMYVPMRVRPDMPMFGYPATEQILVEASEAIRKTFYQLNFWAEGTIPDLVVTVPDTWSPRQIAMFQAHFDSFLSGNTNLKSKVRFLPGGMKPFDIKNSSGESLWSQRDETLIRLACYAFSVSPTPFIKQLNRSTAQASQKSSVEEGLFPLMSYWKDDIIDPIIQERHGYDDIEMVFLPQPESDREKAAKIHDMKIKNGEFSLNESRAESGLEPIDGGDEHMIYIGNAIIPVKDAAGGMALPNQGGAQPGGGQNPGGGKPVGVGARGTGNPLPGPRTGLLRGPATSSQTAGPVDKASKSELRQAQREASGHLHNLSSRQLEAGNYPKGHIWLHGLNISIENKRGSVRGRKDAEGNVAWNVKMPTAYGYIRGTVGADGDHVDVFLGPDPASEKVWVIDQHRVSKKGNIKNFDEHKVMLGYRSSEKALKDYWKSQTGRSHRGVARSVFEMNVKELKSWLSDGDTRAPLAGQGYGIAVGGTVAKSDTISVATNLNWRGTKKKKKSRNRQGPRWMELQA